jgi:hypothetical protein
MMIDLKHQKSALNLIDIIVNEKESLKLKMPIEEILLIALIYQYKCRDFIYI